MGLHKIKFNDLFAINFWGHLTSTQECETAMRMGYKDQYEVPTQVGLRRSALLKNVSGQCLGPNIYSGTED